MSENKFSVTELAILRMLAGNMFDSEIAFALDISQKELSSYRRNLFEKLNVDDRTAACDVAVKLGLIQTDL